MIGDNIGPLIWRGIVERVRGIAADYWLLAAALVLFLAAIWVGGAHG